VVGELTQRWNAGLERVIGVPVGYCACVEAGLVNIGRGIPCALYAACSTSLNCRTGCFPFGIFSGGTGLPARSSSIWNPSRLRAGRSSCPNCLIGCFPFIFLDLSDLTLPASPRFPSSSGSSDAAAALAECKAGPTSSMSSRKRDWRQVLLLRMESEFEDSDGSFGGSAGGAEVETRFFDASIGSFKSSDA
jgi:hypothetical protein